MSAFIPPTPRQGGACSITLLTGLTGILLLVTSVSQAGSLLGWW